MADANETCGKCSKAIIVKLPGNRAMMFRDCVNPHSFTTVMLMADGTTTAESPCNTGKYVEGAPTTEDLSKQAIQ